MSLRNPKVLVGTAALAAVAVVAGCGTNGTHVSLSETGSSLLYPLFNSQWIQAYQSVDPNVQLTAASTGSGAGIAQSTSGAVDLGASDAYLPPLLFQKKPDIMNIPVAISAQQIMYNLPGVKGHLKLTGKVIAEIYMGKVKYWDDSAITSLNPGLSLPHKSIIPVRRSDGSGDTFLFTQFLTNTSNTWKSGPAFGTSISWPPLSTELGGKGNDGVVSALSTNKYSISYVGISWLNRATQAGLGYAKLQNKAGNFVLPTASNIQSAASHGAQNVPPNEAISLVYGPGANSYPITNFEYIIVTKDQLSSAKASALKSFLSWAIDPTKGNGSQYMTPVHFLPLPSNIESISQAQINQIH